MKPHKVIWLQYEEPDPDGMADEGDITWCQDKINDSDTKYVLADEAEMSQLQVKRYAMALDAAEKRDRDRIKQIVSMQNDIDELEAVLASHGPEGHNATNAQVVVLRERIAALTKALKAAEKALHDDHDEMAALIAIYTALRDSGMEGNLPAEKECVWKPTTAHHMTSCGRHAMVKQGNYCPYCGGTIRIEEDT